MRPVFYVPVAGTGGWNDTGAPKRRWWQKGSNFAGFMAGINCIMLYPDQPFIWSTDLGGIQFWRRWPIWFGTVARLRDHRDWVAAGENLERYLNALGHPEPYENRNVIAHSHGGQVVFYACAFGLKIRNLITVATPDRADMDETIRAARPNIGFWAHICDSRADSIASWGQFGDGSLRRDRTFNVPELRPDVRVQISGISHSRILSDSTKIPLWESEHLADYLGQDGPTSN